MEKIQEFTQMTPSDTEIWIHSMGKRFRLVAITSSDSETNEVCRKNPNVGLIADFGQLQFIANLYQGVK